MKVLQHIYVHVKMTEWTVSPFLKSCWCEFGFHHMRPGKEKHMHSGAQSLAPCGRLNPYVWSTPFVCVVAPLWGPPNHGNVPLRIIISQTTEIKKGKAKKEIRLGGHVLGGGLHLREMECTGGLKTNKGLIISCRNCWGQCTPAHLPSTSAVSPDVSSSTPALWSLSQTSAWMVLIPARASWSHSCLCAVAQREICVILLPVCFHLTLSGSVDLNTHKHTETFQDDAELNLYNGR